MKIDNSVDWDVDKSVRAEAVRVILEGYKVMLVLKLEVDMSNYLNNIMWIKLVLGITKCVDKVVKGAGDEVVNYLK